MFVGLDIGTSSSKAVAVADDGRILQTASRAHVTAMPHSGHFEHDADQIWWSDTRLLLSDLLTHIDATAVEAVCVSGIGPCALVADAAGTPLRPAILYGIDTRAEAEIAESTIALGPDAVFAHVGNALTTQAVGPKLLWIARNEPDVWRRARRWYTASSFVVGRLTDEYVIDHYSASASDPLYDLHAFSWWEEGWQQSAGPLEQPRLAWPGEVVGTVTKEAAGATGLPRGVPVLAGTIDALADAYSVGCKQPGDTMVMYGSTLFLIQTVAEPAFDPRLWAAAGVTSDTFSVAAGMATTGLITGWLADLAGASVAALLDDAKTIPAGAGGLVLLPYFSGERTPIFDPQARGVWMGLTLAHSRGHLYRSVLEGVAFGARHNLETMAAVGGLARRVVAVGGGTTGDLWTQIVSDVTGLPQSLPTITIGASYGDARWAAEACGRSTADWNPDARTVEPAAELREVYDELYGVYLRAYPALREDMHVLAARHV